MQKRLSYNGKTKDGDHFKTINEENLELSERQR